MITNKIKASPSIIKSTIVSQIYAIVIVSFIMFIMITSIHNNSFISFCVVIGILVSICKFSFDAYKLYTIEIDMIRCNEFDKISLDQQSELYNIVDKDDAHFIIIHNKDYSKYKFLNRFIDFSKIDWDV